MHSKLFRKSSLDDIGSPDAEPGSESWAKWLVNRAKITAKTLEDDVSSLQQLLVRLEKFEAWKALGYASFGLLCSKELKLSDADVDAIKSAKRGAKLGDVIQRAADAKPLAEHGGDRKSEEANQGDIITLKRGTDPDYLTARIARDRPDILDRMKAGEFGSVRAAAIEAGIVKVKTPLETLWKAWERCSEAERQSFLDAITE